MKSNLYRPPTVDEANADAQSQPTQPPSLQYGQTIQNVPIIGTEASAYGFSGSTPIPMQGQIPQQMDVQSQSWILGNRDSTMYGTVDMSGTIPQPPLTTQPVSKPSHSRPRKGTNAPETRQPKQSKTLSQTTAQGTEKQHRGRPPMPTPPSTSASGATPGQNDPDVEKTRLRQRNREAASKCRVRKKQDIDKLQAEEAEAQAINKTLHGEVARLKEEVLTLKAMVLEHGACPCPYIQSYIQNAAVNVVQSSVARDGGESLLPGT